MTLEEILVLGVVGTIVVLGTDSFLARSRAKNTRQKLNAAEDRINVLLKSAKESEAREKALLSRCEQLTTTINQNDISNKNHVKSLQERCHDLEGAIRQKDVLYGSLERQDNQGYVELSSMMADHLTLQYEISARYLETKKHPAMKEARRIREIRNETREIVARHKLMEYKYNLLFEIFPDLELYIDDMEAIRELGNFKNIGEFKDGVDRTRKYLSSDEYRELNERERNQLALDRYIKSQKTKWQIGRDYELFIGHTYSEDGWDVEYTGIEKQLEDMGRDLIVVKMDTIKIIQCKYWSTRKLIHEKHIAQLFGTTVQYQLENNTGKKVESVFITNIFLSETAERFAEHLGVEVINIELDDFPRIKCNAGVDEDGRHTKIYHLPMDQQYDRTKINGPNDVFSYTVKEAERAGFRRAKRWFG